MSSLNCKHFGNISLVSQFSGEQVQHFYLSAELVDLLISWLPGDQAYYSSGIRFSCYLCILVTWISGLVDVYESWLHKNQVQQFSMYLGYLETRFTSSLCILVTWRSGLVVLFAFWLPGYQVQQFSMCILVIWRPGLLVFYVSWLPGDKVYQFSLHFGYLDIRFSSSLCILVTWRPGLLVSMYPGYLETRFASSLCILVTWKPGLLVLIVSLLPGDQV